MRSPKIRRTTLLTAALLAAAVAIAGGVSFYRKAETFQPLGLEVEQRAGHWLVAQVAAPGSGLRAGDRIVLVNGRALGEVAELGEALRRRPVSELVVLRGERMTTVSHPLPPLRIDFPYLILALIGTGYLLIGAYTLLRDGRRPAALFFVWCLTSALLYLVTATPPFDGVDRLLFGLDQLARVLLAPLTLHLFTVFPRPPQRRELVQRAVPFLYLPAAFLLLLQTDLAFFDGGWLFGGRVGPALRVLDQLELFHLVGFSAAAAAVLGWRLRRTPGGEPARQTAWIAIGAGVGYLPFAALYLVPRALGWTPSMPVASAAVLPLALVPLTFAYAILRYKLWDIGGIVRHTTSLALTALVGVVGFSLANLVINRALPDQAAFARTLLSFVSGLGIAGLLIPTRRGVSASLERLQYGSDWAKRRALSDFGREVLRERSLGRLCTALLERLRAGLGLRPATLLLAHGDRLLPFQPHRTLPAELTTGDFEEGFWDAEVEILTGVEFPAERLEPLARLFTAGYRYAFPLRVREQRIGVLLTGYKEGQTPLSSDDEDLVRGLLNQASLAMENAQLLEQVQQQLDEVVRLQRYSQGIIESSPAGIAVTDPNGRVLSANAALAALAGIEPAAAIGRPLTELLPLDRLPEPGQGLSEVKLTGGGGDRYLQVSAAPLQEEADERRVVVVQDVTERVEMENTLKEKERLASLGMLAAGVAHEVNTPITGISSYAQMLLADTPEGDPRRELLHKVERQTFRAAQIVNNLLEFARDRQRERRPLSLAPLLSECLELLAERLAEGRATLEWQPPQEPVQVVGNEVELQQVFTNLVLNAVDALQAGGGGRLAVDLEADGDRVRVAIEDDGPGIAETELAKIFQPFYSTKLARGGTGLGLSISYSIARRHGGDLRVESRPGEGSRFIVEMPRFQPSREQPPSPEQ